MSNEMKRIQQGYKNLWVIFVEKLNGGDYFANSDIISITLNGAAVTSGQLRYLYDFNRDLCSLNTKETSSLVTITGHGENGFSFFNLIAHSDINNEIIARQQADEAEAMARQQADNKIAEKIPDTASPENQLVDRAEMQSIVNAADITAIDYTEGRNIILTNGSGASISTMVLQASSEHDGLMTTADVDTLTKLVSDVTSIKEGGIWRAEFGTYADLITTFPNLDVSSTNWFINDYIELLHDENPTQNLHVQGSPSLFRVVVDGETKTLAYWKDVATGGTATGVAIATNNSLGVVRGDVAVSGKVYVETNGSMSVNGWDATQQAIAGKLAATAVANSAAKIATARVFTIADDSINTPSFDGSENITLGVPVTIAASGDNNALPPTQKVTLRAWLTAARSCLSWLMSQITSLNDSLANKVDKDDSGWVPLTPINGAAGTDCAIRRIGGIVHCRGPILVDRAAETGIVVFNLPDGFAPSGAARVFMCSTNSGVDSTYYLRLIFRNNGNVEIHSRGNGTAFALDGIMYMI